MNYTSLESKIKNLIAKKSEGEYWDFKQEWHNDNERLLHDCIFRTHTDTVFENIRTVISELSGH